jgi:L-fuconolactonase
MRVSRRSFVAGALGVAASLNARAAEQKGVQGDPIIDTHQHLWDLKQFHLPWLKAAGARLNQTFTAEDYAKAVEGLNVEKAVYEEVAVVAQERQAEADFVVELCRGKKTRTVAGIIAGDPSDDGFEKYIRQFKASPYIKGLRHSYPRGGSEDKRFVNGIRLLGELGMSFDLLAGGEQVKETASLAAACPNTRLVLDHCGNANVKWFEGLGAQNPAMRLARRAWEEGISRLAEQKNVVCKISGVAESGDDGKVTAEVVAPVVNYCLDRFGEERVMFASNWPVCLKTISLKAWVEVLKEVVTGRGPGLGKKLFFANAAKFFEL